MAIQTSFERRINGMSVRLIDWKEYPKNGEFSMILPFNRYLSLPKKTGSAYPGVREQVLRDDKIEIFMGKVEKLQRQLRFGTINSERTNGEPDWSYAKISDDGQCLEPGSVVILEHSGTPFMKTTKQLLLAVMLTGTRDQETNRLVLKKTAENCLNVAYDKKFQSISFPLEVPHHREVDFEDKAMTFYQAARDFARKYEPESNPVKNITFYLHNVFDESLVRVAQRYYGNLFPPRKP